VRRRPSTLWAPLATVLVALLLVVATAATTVALTRTSPKTVVAAPESILRVAVIGDSYTSGLNNTVVWPSLLASHSQLALSNVAFPGAGYVGGTGESGPLADQADKALASKPDVIVVFGGINDVGRSSDLITQAAIDLFTSLARRAPNASLLVFGPIWHEPNLPQSFYALDDAIAAGARSSHARYTSLIREGWLVGDGLIQADQVHPTDAGQMVLERELGPLLLAQVRDRDTGVRP
jgi:lysophospholipase L1-like esterase